MAMKMPGYGQIGTLKASGSLCLIFASNLDSWFIQFQNGYCYCYRNVTREDTRELLQIPREFMH